MAKGAESPIASRWKITDAMETYGIRGWGKGYFGIITAGGSEFATFLASRGLNGISGLKDALKNRRS